MEDYEKKRRSFSGENAVSERNKNGMLHKYGRLRAKGTITKFVSGSWQISGSFKNFFILALVCGPLVGLMFNMKKKGNGMHLWWNVLLGNPLGVQERKYGKLPTHPELMVAKYRVGANCNYTWQRRQRKAER